MTNDQKHPFPLLLYLEWILLGIALLAALSPLVHHLNTLFIPRRAPRVLFTLGAVASIGTVGGIGLRLPMGSWVVRSLYTGLGFALSWLAVMLGGQGGRLFPALLLIVVIRGCLMFPWRGRIIVAVFAHSSFLLMLLMSFMRIRPLGVRLTRLPLPPGARRMPPEFLQGVLVNFMVNSALLFGLVLVFVLLLVGALLAEKQSRQELTNANSRLRQYALLIENQATLQERNRIAREIHDSLGHSLTAQSIQLENVAMLLGSDPERAAYHLQEARRLGKEGLQNVRQSVASLRTHPLKGKSLTAALTKLLQEFEATSNIELETHINLGSNLSAEISTAVYRVIQEALTNVSKHSNATLVRLRISSSPRSIDLLLVDNGRGFEPGLNTTGFGVQGMGERISALGGTFSLSSKPGQGCKIKVHIPCS